MIRGIFNKTLQQNNPKSNPSTIFKLFLRGNEKKESIYAHGGPLGLSAAIIINNSPDMRRIHMRTQPPRQHAPDTAPQYSGFCQHSGSSSYSSSCGDGVETSSSCGDGLSRSLPTQPCTVLIKNIETGRLGHLFRSLASFSQNMYKPRTFMKPSFPSGSIQYVLWLWVSMQFPKIIIPKHYSRRRSRTQNIYKIMVHFQ